MQAHEVPTDPVAVDTDVFSWLHLGKPERAGFMPHLQGHPLAMSFATAGELKVLGIPSKWGEERVGELERAIGSCVVLPGDAGVVDQWGALHARFIGRLKDGGINDLWTAACCLVHELPLATGNLSNFGHIAEEFPRASVGAPER